MNRSLLILIALSLLLTSRSFSAEPVPSYSATASELVTAACQKAAAESKLIFLKSGHPQCGWCVVFDRYHHHEAVRQILERYLVVVAIDTVNMPDGAAVFERFAKVGAPAWVILTAERKTVVDSYNQGRNVGYPLQPEETAYYLAALKQAVPAMTAEELGMLGEQIKKAVKK